MNTYRLTLKGSFVQSNDNCACDLDVNSTDGLNISVTEQGDNAYVVLDKVVDKLIDEYTGILRQNKQKEPTLEEKYRELERKYNELERKIAKNDKKIGGKNLQNEGNNKETPSVKREVFKSDVEDVNLPYITKSAKNNKKAIFHKSCDSKHTDLDTILDELTKMLNN